ncbi:hypothetical protein BC829DRAFT_382084 [Chytridium lagenaria]|nr:hypothetical protein BC829DRAFT_382084 [Chytridium lagenaria]
MILERFLGSKAESIIEVVDRESFLRKLETRLPVLRYAVCAYAAHHSYPKAPYHVARKYYMKARDLAKASIGKPSFQALQSLILLRALSMAMSDNMHGFFFLEAALKMSSQLELKVTWTDGRLEISSSRELEDDVDLKELRKCWMACYFHDRMGAIASGQPHFLPVIGGLHDEAILDAGSPVDLDSTSSSTTPQPTLQDIPGVSPSHSTTSATPTANPSPTPKSDPDPLDHLMKLLDIAFQIHRAAKKPITCEQELRDRWHHLESAEAALSSWAFGVPVWMLSEPTLDWCLQTFNSSSDTPIPWSALTVLFLYHSLRCFLHRPRLSLEAALTDAAGGVGGLGFGGHTDQSIVRKLEALGIPGAVEVTAESAFVVARTVAKILLADPGVRDMNPPMAFCLTTVSIGLGDLAKRRGTYLLAAGGMGGWKSPPQPRPIKDEPTQGKYSRLLAHTNPGMSPGPEGLGECLEGVEAVLAVMRNLLPYWNVMQFVMLLEGIMANVRKWEDDVVARMRG